jgi:diguanylate cyclase (GGDEF)-like protein
MENVIFYVKNLFVMRKVVSGMESRESISCDCVSSLTEARAALEKNQPAYFLAIVEAPVVDADTREAIGYFRTKGLSSVILTNGYTDAIQEVMTSLGIMDYIIKDELFVENLTRTVGRIRRNLLTEILIVDDSAVSRKQARNILELQKIIVREAENGQDALALLGDHPEIRMMLTDYHMPGMNGVELMRAARKIRPEKRLTVIGLSDIDNPGLSVRLLKNGADDFLYKSFISEELYLRVVQNLEMAERIEELRQSSHTDYLTRLYNRRFFFEVGEKLFENAKRNNLTVAMLDIDHFKLVNDRFGHDIGDLAIKLVAAALTRTVRAGDVVARYGGEEFCVIAVNVDKQNAPVVFERIRANVAEGKIDTDDGGLSVTVSVGAATVMGKTLEETINKADKLMYEAKTGGRNRVVIE